MSKNFLKILIILSLLFILSCEKFDDTVLIIKVISSADSTAIENVKVNVYKRKNTVFEWGYKIVDSYEEYTDNQGICNIVINNYNRDKYDYSIDVNYHSGNPPDFGGYTFSAWGTVLEEYELKDTLSVRLTKIPFYK